MPALETKNLAAFFAQHYQIIGVLIGVLLVLGASGVYTNWDAQTEFEAASSVVTQGFPYVTTGLIIDQAPLAFYLTAPALLLFGVSYLNGVAVVTAMALGCVVLVYALGTVLYSKWVGAFAAALFGLVPWQVYMSRTYLIDSPYLFLGLLFLFVGVLAVKRNSTRLVAVSGVLFALAFLTKLFAVFLLLPLLLVVLLKRNEYGFKVSFKRILIFLVPSFALQAVWYGAFANQHFFGVYVPSDFTHNVQILDPSLTFLLRIVVESAGWFLPLAAVLALVLAVAFRRLFAGRLWADAVCIISIAGILAVDTSLVFGLHMLVPYVSAFKYTYAALPFLCLFAASLIDKGAVLISRVDAKKTVHALKLLLVGLGVTLLLASLLESILYLNTWTAFAAFEVDSSGHYFPFNVASPGLNSGLLQASHFAALGLIMFCCVSPLIVRALRRRE